MTMFGPSSLIKSIKKKKINGYETIEVTTVYPGQTEWGQVPGSVFTIHTNNKAGDFVADQIRKALKEHKSIDKVFDKEAFKGKETEIANLLKIIELCVPSEEKSTHSFRKLLTYVGGFLSLAALLTPFSVALIETFLSLGISHLVFTAFIATFTAAFPPLFIAITGAALVGFIISVVAAVKLEKRDLLLAELLKQPFEVFEIPNVKSQAESEVSSHQEESYTNNIQQSENQNFPTMEELMRLETLRRAISKVEKKAKEEEKRNKEQANNNNQRSSEEKSSKESISVVSQNSNSGIVQRLNLASKNSSFNAGEPDSNSFNSASFATAQSSASDRDSNGLPFMDQYEEETQRKFMALKASDQKSAQQNNIVIELDEQKLEALIQADLQNENSNCNDEYSEEVILALSQLSGIEKSLENDAAYQAEKTLMLSQLDDPKLPTEMPAAISSLNKNQVVKPNYIKAFEELLNTEKVYVTDLKKIAPYMNRAYNAIQNNISKKTTVENDVAQRASVKLLSYNEYQESLFEEIEKSDHVKYFEKNVETLYMMVGSSQFADQILREFNVCRKYPVNLKLLNSLCEDEENNTIFSFLFKSKTNAPVFDAEEKKQIDFLAQIPFQRLLRRQLPIADAIKYYQQHLIDNGVVEDKTLGYLRAIQEKFQIWSRFTNKIKHAEEMIDDGSSVDMGASCITSHDIQQMGNRVQLNNTVQPSKVDQPAFIQSFEALASTINIFLLQNMNIDSKERIQLTNIFTSQFQKITSHNFMTKFEDLANKFREYKHNYGLPSLTAYSGPGPEFVKPSINSNSIQSNFEKIQTLALAALVDFNAINANEKFFTAEEQEAVAQFYNEIISPDQDFQDRMTCRL